MANDKLSAQNNDEKYTEIIDKPARIYITKKTVRFGQEVYQFNNITGFAVSTVKIPNIIPTSWFLVLFVLGSIIGIVPTNDARAIGILMSLIGFIGICSNFSQPKHRGLGIYLNSGHRKIFITTDIKGLEEIVAILYKYMDSDEEKGTYVVNVVGGNVTGNFVGGDAHNNNLDFK
jgi:hypothetical protein